MNDTDRSLSPARRVRALLAASAGVCLLGLALTGTGNRPLGGMVLLLGWGGLIYAIHRFGRLGTAN